MRERGEGGWWEIFSRTFPASLSRIPDKCPNGEERKGKRIGFRGTKGLAFLSGSESSGEKRTIFNVWTCPGLSRRGQTARTERMKPAARGRLRPESQIFGPESLRWRAVTSLEMAPFSSALRSGDPGALPNAPAKKKRKKKRLFTFFLSVRENSGAR